jgi:hypothetical protein
LSIGAIGRSAFHSIERRNSEILHTGFDIGSPYLRVYLQRGVLPLAALWSINRCGADRCA